MQYPYRYLVAEVELKTPKKKMLTILVLHNHIDVLHWQSKEEQEQLALLLSFFHCKKVNRTIIIQHLGRYLVAEAELKTEQFVLNTT